MATFASFLSSTRPDFERTNTPLTKPLVIHAVAGAGKTTLLRDFLRANPLTNAQTLGTPDCPTLDGAYIRPFSGPVANLVNILDEYTAQPVTGSWDVLVADPLQHYERAKLPHYICKRSHRLCPATARLLRKLGLDIHSYREDESEISFSDIFSGQLEGTVLPLTPLCKDLLERHSCPFKCPSEFIGEQDDIITVVSEIPLSKHPDKTALYRALTRHTRRLNVLAPPPYPTP
uniref:TGB1 n=1 Tax=Hosta virus X TaxID=214439 RepID=A0A6G9KNU2_9VIRU|nr:TGB1 [Hosta virus X]